MAEPTIGSGRSEHLDAERRRQLEEERDFLMRSLDDLELEHESGGIDDESYAELHDDYTARAAAVIRALRDGVDVTPPPPPRSPTARDGSCVVAGDRRVRGAGRRVARLRARRPPPGPDVVGQLGGGAVDDERRAKALPQKIDELAGEGQRQARRLRPAARSSPRAYEENGDLPNALKQSDAAITIDPNRPKAHANAARLLYLASEQVPTRTRRRSSSPGARRVRPGHQRGPDYADATSSAPCCTRGRCETSRGAGRSAELPGQGADRAVGRAARVSCSRRSRRRSKARRLPCLRRPPPRRSRPQESRQQERSRAMAQPPAYEIDDARSTARPSPPTAARSSWTSTRSWRRTR